MVLTLLLVELRSCAGVPKGGKSLMFKHSRLVFVCPTFWITQESGRENIPCVRSFQTISLTHSFIIKKSPSVTISPKMPGNPGNSSLPR